MNKFYKKGDVVCMDGLPYTWGQVQMPMSLELLLNRIEALKGGVTATNGDEIMGWISVHRANAMLQEIVENR